jgi:two-component system response regulator NreC
VRRCLEARGHTNQEIAGRLFLSVKTIETYRARIAEKLGLRARAELVRYALEVGLLGPETPGRETQEG